MSFRSCTRLRLLASTLHSAPLARSTSTLRFAVPRATAFGRTVPALARGYSGGGSLDKEQITGRVLEVLKSFEKVDAGKLTTTSSFTSDLGLDSLDAVEVVMAVEEEFSIEIPDAEADAITTVQEAIDYIAKTPEAV